MSSPHTFSGKVITLLIGAVLSWLTVTNADFCASVEALLGEGSSKLVSKASSPERFESRERGLAGELEVSPKAESGSPGIQGPSKIEEIASKLRHLGASYLLLERLPSPNGDQYRVRCDLAGDLSRVKCCFEATRESAEDAMQEVLQAVLNVDSHHSDASTSVVSSM